MTKITDQISNGLDSFDNKLTEWSKPIGKFLDSHPEVYKVCVVGLHFFRAGTMLALMEYLPLPILASAAVMVGVSIFYRGAIERFCTLKFAIPAAIGAMALWVTKAALIAMISGVALAPVALAFALLFLTSYTGWVCYLSHKEVQAISIKKHLNIKNLLSSCCK